MRRHEHIDSQYSREYKDPEQWQPVTTANLRPSALRTFKKRKKALDQYLTSDKPVSQICESVGLSHSELKRIIRRAFESAADGNPMGYAACLPGLRMKAYTRSGKSQGGTAGKFKHFLSCHPELQLMLDEWALGKRKIDQSSVRGSQAKRIWIAFRQACEAAALDVETEYPFSNADGGREAIRRYCRQRRRENFQAGVTVEFGDGAGKLAREKQFSLPRSRQLRPYDLVQLDGHRLDGDFIVTVHDAQGEEVDLILSRIWLLVVVDVASRAVVGYSLSLLENYSAEDVLDCVASVYCPWQQLELPSDRIRYKPDAGLPSGIIAECAWRGFTTLQMDNAWSQTSAWVQGRIIASGAFEIVTNFPDSPRSNSVIERFNQTFEEASLHQFPNTTGSGPSDPRRGDSEKAAKRLRINYEDLCLIADVAISNYNATPHTSLNGVSPLEYLRHRIERGRDLIRQVPARTLEGLSLFEREYPVTIRSNGQQGHRPAIKFQNVVYTSEELQRRGDLSGERAVFRTNIKDIRTGQLFLSDGTCFGTIQAEERWMARPHSLRTRRAIFQLIKKRKLVSDTFTPLSDYANHLAERASDGRKERNRYLKSQRELGTPSAPVPDRRSIRKRRSALQVGWVELKQVMGG